MLGRLTRTKTPRQPPLTGWLLDPLKSFFWHTDEVVWAIFFAKPLGMREFRNPSRKPPFPRFRTVESFSLQFWEVFLCWVEGWKSSSCF